MPCVGRSGSTVGSERGCQSARALRASVFNNWKVNNEGAVNKQLWLNKLFILTILAVFAQRRGICLYVSWQSAPSRLKLRECGVVHMLDSRGRARHTGEPAERLPAFRKQEKKDRGDRKTARRGGEQNRNRGTGHGSEKRHFSQVDQTHPRTEARHEEINRKQLFHIPW